MTPVLILSWACQLYLAFFFYRSAYRKTRGFERVRAEFAGWGYPLPGQITVFLIIVWIICASALLVPGWSGVAAVALLPFMIVAISTLARHREFRRMIEPARPIAALIIVISIRWNEVQDLIEKFVS